MKPPRLLLVSIAVAVVAACSRGAEDDRPKPAEARPVGYGTVMAEVARRFELLGRASSAGRFELADYQLGEIEEAFEDALPHASPPKEGHPEVLPETAAAFLHTNVPDLKSALATHDRALSAAAFERAANACNGCHQASGHGFIQVPLVAGHGVPVLDPVTP